VTEPATLVAIAVVDSNVLCFGEANAGATASATGGTMPFSYSWSNSATTASVSGLIADTFNVVIVDVNGCMDSSSVMITEPPLMVLNIGNDTAICLNETLVLDGGIGYYTYLWSDSSSTQTTVVNTSMAGSFDYSVSVTNINGCLATDTLNVVVNSPMVLSITPIADLCAYGVDTLIATIGFDTYLWSTLDTINKIIIDASILGQGNYSYSLIATDSNGCQSNASTTFGVFNEVSVDLGPDVSILWEDGIVESYTLDAGVGYSSYSWNNGNGTNQTYLVTLSNMGRVHLEVTDANGCLGRDTILVDFILSTPKIEIGTVKMYPNPAHEILNIQMSNFIGQNEVSITIMSVNGSMVFNKTFQPNGSDFNQTVNVSQYSTGTYFVEFIANGQRITKTFIVR
jgi:hypothetical protein